MAKRDTTLTFYGGVNEIGGNKILLRDGDTKVFFNFGMSFSIARAAENGSEGNRRGRNLSHTHGKR